MAIEKCLKSREIEQEYKEKLAELADTGSESWDKLHEDTQHALQQLEDKVNRIISQFE